MPVLPLVAHDDGVFLRMAALLASSIIAMPMRSLTAAERIGKNSH